MQNEQRCETSCGENGERERKKKRREVLSLCLPILFVARFASPLVLRRWNACMQANIKEKAGADQCQE